MGSSWALPLILSFFFLGSCLKSLATNVTYDGRAIVINGERRILVSGSIHYPRSTPEMWPDLIQKAKEGGLDAIETYVFWNAHEPRRREYNFEGNLDLIKFIKLVQGAGLYLVLRIGPYVCAEWNYGGFPIWLHQLPGVQLRTDNEIYKDEMQNFTTLIVNMIKQENLLAPQGGPIILTQIENEYGNIMDKYGAAGKSYIQWCAKMAESLDVGVPWIMCQQADAPQPMINTCNGYYCYKFQPNNLNSPKMWTENWVGWFKAWGGPEPHRPAEDVAFAVAHFFASGGTFQNYYMYHGGTNFGRTSGGPFLTTSYDYDAPLDEYGNLRQPKWGHLKQLHTALKSIEKALTYGNVNSTSFSNSATVTKYSNETGASCFLVNANQSNAANLTFEGNQYFLPPWSISILPDCKQEIYNTAKINTQTSLMVKKAVVESSQLKWEWRAEIVKDTLKGVGTFADKDLKEQINTTSDTSDYLWYMTSVMLDNEDLVGATKLTLRVKTTGHLLHAYVNKHLVGSQYATKDNYHFLFEGDVRVRRRTVHVTLLSGTVGLSNYGAFFDLVPAGIVGGPVQLILNGNKTIDLSSNIWTYKIGLNGERKKIYSAPNRFKWYLTELPLNRSMTWYKATFEIPPGDDPLVLDLLGMGKGHAWVNGQSLGRYWPMLIAPSDQCKPCNYNKNYKPDDCQTGCGEPSQRWYHVPRSFTTSGPNTLVLFEEVGGNPFNVSLHTVTVGTACGNALEGSTLELSCQGNATFSEIKFASFGDPHGSCGSFQKGGCGSLDTLTVVQKACIGQSKCSFNITEDTFGSSGCGNITKRLAVQAVC